MKDNKAYEKRLNDAIEHFKLNIDQYINPNPEYKKRLLGIENIFIKHKEDPDFTSDGIKKILTICKVDTSKVAAAILSYLFHIKNTIIVTSLKNLLI